MLDVLHDDRMLCFVDPVQHAPLSAEPCTVESTQRAPERLADPVRLGQKRPSDEFDGCGGGIPWQQLRDRATGRAGHSEFIGPGIHRLRSANSARAAPAP